MSHHSSILTFVSYKGIVKTNLFPFRQVNEKEILFYFFIP